MQYCRPTDAAAAVDNNDDDDKVIYNIPDWHEHLPIITVRWQCLSFVRSYIEGLELLVHAALLMKSTVFFRSISERAKRLLMSTCEMCSRCWQWTAAQRSSDCHAATLCCDASDMRLWAAWNSDDEGWATERSWPAVLETRIPVYNMSSRRHHHQCQRAGRHVDDVLCCVASVWLRFGHINSPSRSVYQVV